MLAKGESQVSHQLIGGIIFILLLTGGVIYAKDGSQAFGTFVDQIPIFGSGGESFIQDLYLRYDILEDRVEFSVTGVFDDWALLEEEAKIDIGGKRFSGSEVGEFLRDFYYSDREDTTYRVSSSESDEVFGSELPLLNYIAFSLESPTVGGVGDKTSEVGFRAVSRVGWPDKDDKIYGTVLSRVNGDVYIGSSEGIESNVASLDKVVSLALDGSGAEDLWGFDFRGDEKIVEDFERFDDEFGGDNLDSAVKELLNKKSELETSGAFLEIKPKWDEGTINSNVVKEFKIESLEISDLNGKSWKSLGKSQCSRSVAIIKENYDRLFNCEVHFFKLDNSEDDLGVILRVVVGTSTSGTGSPNLFWGVVGGELSMQAEIEATDRVLSGNTKYRGFVEEINNAAWEYRDLVLEKPVKIGEGSYCGERLGFGDKSYVVFDLREDILEGECGK